MNYWNLVFDYFYIILKILKICIIFINLFTLCYLYVFDPNIRLTSIELMTSRLLFSREKKVTCFQTEQNCLEWASIWKRQNPQHNPFCILWDFPSWNTPKLLFSIWIQWLIYKGIWQIRFIMPLENGPALLKLQRDSYATLLWYQPISRNVSGPNKRKTSVTVCIFILLTFRVVCFFMLIGH